MDEHVHPPRRQGRIDRDAIRFGISKLRRSDIYALLDRAIGLLSADKLAELSEGYADVRALSTGGRKRGRTSLLAAVQAFEEASLRHDYYDAFDVTSKNFTEISEGTSAWMAECGRRFERCIAESKTQPAAEVCQAFETLFSLLRILNSDPDRLVFFADEGGAWQVEVPWTEVLHAWFGALSATASPDEYARKVLDVVDEFEHHRRARHLATAARIATPLQRAALRARDTSRTPDGSIHRRRTAHERAHR